MNSESLKPLKDEVEPMLLEILSNRNLSEVLQKHSMSESEAAEVEYKISAVEVEFKISLTNQRTVRKCTKYFATCPKNIHPPVGCEHTVDCITSQLLD